MIRSWAALRTVVRNVRTRISSAVHITSAVKSRDRDEPLDDELCQSSCQVSLSGARRAAEDDAPVLQKQVDVALQDQLRYQQLKRQLVHRPVATAYTPTPLHRINSRMDMQTPGARPGY